MSDRINIDAESQNSGWIKLVAKSRLKVTPKAKRQIIIIPRITLKWSDWYSWHEINENVWLSAYDWRNLEP